MTLLLAERDVSLVRGSQEPRIYCAPPFECSTGGEAVDLALMAGLVLDPWQRQHLTAALGEKRSDSGLRWAAFEVGLVVPRQNGKNGLLEARQLTGLFLLEELLSIHSAHMADTSVEQFNRLAALIEATPELSRRVKNMPRGKGSESIQLHRHPVTGRAPRLTFRTRTGGGGRGFSCDCLYFDEAMILPESFHGALMPTLSARPDPQVYYTGSAVDKEVHEDGVVLARVRARALRGDDPSLVYSEWSMDAESPDHVTEEMARDPDLLAGANPELGKRITLDYVLKEQRSMSARAYAVERGGVGDWPDPEGVIGRPISPAMWNALADEESEALNPVCFALDVTPDRSMGAIGVAGLRPDGRTHVEVVEHARGTAWMASRVAELVETHGAGGVVLDASGPVGSLLPDLAHEGVNVTALTPREHSQACGAFYDLAEQDKLRHLATSELGGAVAGAVKRPLGEAWAWSRKNSSIDISPLVAVTLAAWALNSNAAPYDGPLIELL